jgi:HrpA-like RNA helicase
LFKTLRLVQVVNVIENNDVSIIQGEPGCGKSTQVPQMILKNAALRNRPAYIIVTQPRRIAAKSLARFVCKQRDWQLGDLVGYQVRKSVKLSVVILAMKPWTVVAMMVIVRLKETLSQRR